MNQKNNLKVTITNFGFFYKGSLNGEKLSWQQLFEIIGIKKTYPRTLEYHLDNFQANNLDYTVTINEISVD